MQNHWRAIFPWAVGLLAIASILWAASIGRLPPADFTFVNGTEVESIDPAKIAGEPEGRVVDAIFEGLYGVDPKTLEPIPAVAESYEMSDDRVTYTFHIRPTAQWTDGTPVTAEDFVFSWKRLMHPETASRYNSFGYYLKNGQRFADVLLEPGDPVEIELNDRRDESQLFPSGTLWYGQLDSIREVLIDGEPAKIYSVSIDGKLQEFCTEETPETKHCRHVLLDFRAVGAVAKDARTLVVTLERPAPYFLGLVSFYPFFPVQRACIEKYGTPAWTKPDNLVSNGAFQIEFRRIRDRIRLKKNPHYWGAQQVRLNTVDVLAGSSEDTNLNLYLAGKADWLTNVPPFVIPDLLKREDFDPSPKLSIYFYRINTTKKPLDDVRVRQALSLALNRQEIVSLTKAGDIPATSLVPPGLPGYESPPLPPENELEAQRLLAEAGYPHGKDFPTVELLYNTNEVHKEIAELVQAQWRRVLGVRIQLRNMEWGSYLARCQSMDYEIARAGWIGDYVDPNTFLDLFITGNPNNETGYSNPKYDELIRRAANETDSTKRLALFREAEAMVLEAMPVIPFYYYVDKNLVRPYVKGFHRNIRDIHPLQDIWIDEEEKARVLAAEGLHP